MCFQVNQWHGMQNIFLQVCEDDKRLVHYAKGGGSEPTGKRMGEKMFKPTEVALPTALQPKFGNAAHRSPTEVWECLMICKM
jgi:hypothetical protein